MVIVSGTTRLLGVIGDPVEHSFSPLMHNAAIAAMGLDYVYVPLPVKAADLAVAVDGFAAIGLRGFSITIPHKQAILPLLSQVSPVAEAVGAVNTVWREADGWHGTNTDIAGFLAPLRSLRSQWQGTVAVVLGNGGAARAVVAGCNQLGCAEIIVVGRNSEKLQAFQQGWPEGELKEKLSLVPWSEAATAIDRAQLLVNATPVGMAPRIDASPLDEAAIAAIQPETVAYDLIYTPNPTRFLQQAHDRGAVALDGLEMLVQQGAAALEIWTGQSPPADIMRRTLRQHLGLE